MTRKRKPSDYPVRRYSTHKKTFGAEIDELQMALMLRCPNLEPQTPPDQRILDLVADWMEIWAANDEVLSAVKRLPESGAKWHLLSALSNQDGYAQLSHRLEVRLLNTDSTPIEGLWIGDTPHYAAPNPEQTKPVLDWVEKHFTSVPARSTWEPPAMYALAALHEWCRASWQPRFAESRWRHPNAETHDKLYEVGFRYEFYEQGQKKVIESKSWNLGALS